MITTTYQVTGMTCAHCVAAVTEEVGRLDGVGSVEVDLAESRVTVTSTAPLAFHQVAVAVDEAGYVLEPLA